jgi:hypothetical protein
MLYLIFALATSLTALIILIRPVLKLIEKDHPLSVVIQNKFITYFTFFILTMLAAPLLIIITIIPDLGERFKVSLEESLSAV